LKETAVPPGYALQTTTYTVVVGEDGWISVNGESPVAEKTSRYNNKPNKLTINMVEDGDIPLEGAYMGLYIGDEIKYTCTSNNEGKCVITKIFPNNYTLKEIEQPDGYVLSHEEQSVGVTIDGWIKVEEQEKVPEAETKMLNHPTIIELYKRDGVTAELMYGAGIKFRLVGPHNYSKEVEITEARGYEFTHLKRGNYVITEISTLEGWITSQDNMSFRVEHDGLVKANNKYVNLFTYFNFEKPILNIRVKDKDTEEIIDNAKIKIKNKITGETEEVDLGEQTLVLDEGEYEIEQIITPDGYIISDYNPTIEVLGSGIIYVDGERQEERGEITYYNEPNKIAIRNVDEKGERLEGTVIGIYKDGVEIERFETGSEDNIFERLEPGEYEVKQITAPEGYMKDNNTYTFVVDENGVSQDVIILENELMPKIHIKVVDKDTGEEVEGEKVEILDKEGNVVGSFESKKDPESDDYEGRLPYGEYKIKEKEPAEGYKPNEEEKDIELDGNSEKEIEIVIYVEPYYEIKVKVEDKDGNPIDDGKYGLYDEEHVLIKEIEPDENGEIIIDELEKGKYIIKEIESPEGYKEKEEELEIELVVGEKTKEVRIVYEMIEVPNTDNANRTIIISFIVMMIGMMLVIMKLKNNKEKI
jgi:uncharacterized surface anchored protein